MSIPRAVPRGREQFENDFLVRVQNPLENNNEKLAEDVQPRHPVGRMKGDPQIIELLNTLLTHELTSVNQYWVHARMCENWGYQKLWEKLRAESIDEMKHADQLIARILFLDGVPNLQRLNPIQVGETVEEQFKIDLESELGILPKLNEALHLCQKQNDHGTFELLKEILVSEEEHTDWIEAQLDLIKQVGIQNYLATQI